MRYAISFIFSFIAALVIALVGWRRRPATRPEKVTGFGWASLVLGALAVLTIVPSVTAPFSMVISGLGLLTGVLALLRSDTHVLTIVGQCLVALATLFWVFFLVAELIFPH